MRDFVLVELQILLLPYLHCRHAACCLAGRQAVYVYISCMSCIICIVLCCVRACAACLLLLCFPQLLPYLPSLCHCSVSLLYHAAAVVQYVHNTNTNYARILNSDCN